MQNYKLYLKDIFKRQKNVFNFNYFLLILIYHVEKY